MSAFRVLTDEEISTLITGFLRRDHTMSPYMLKDFIIDVEAAVIAKLVSP